MPPAVPKPKEKGPYSVTCSACGSDGWYTLDQMNNHLMWCKLAKAKKEKAAKKKKAKANRAPKRR